MRARCAFNEFEIGWGVLETLSIIITDDLSLRCAKPSRCQHAKILVHLEAFGHALGEAAAEPDRTEVGHRESSVARVPARSLQRVGHA